jgi:hypothetical protein
LEEKQGGYEKVGIKNMLLVTASIQEGSEVGVSQHFKFWSESWNDSQ